MQEPSCGKMGNGGFTTTCQRGETKYFSGTYNIQKPLSGTDFNQKQWDPYYPLTIFI